MKVLLLEPSGYCAGVESAFKLAIKTREDNPNDKIVVLGQLVHNQDALKVLEKHNIKTIYEPGVQLIDLVDDIKENSIVILTAHGHSKELEDKIKSKGLRVVDATCPYVSKAHKDIEEAINDGHYVFYIGIKDHPEANAALSINDKVFLVEPNQEVVIKIDDDEPRILIQTTLSTLDVAKQIALISYFYPNCKIIESICHASQSRQSAILGLPREVELIYIVGGKNSNNTKTLYNLAKLSFPRKKVMLIENKEDINKKDLLGLNCVAISSGASTPKSVSVEIKQYIEELFNN